MMTCTVLLSEVFILTYNWQLLAYWCVYVPYQMMFYRVEMYRPEGPGPRLSLGAHNIAVVQVKTAWNQSALAVCIHRGMTSFTGEGSHWSQRSVSPARGVCCGRPCGMLCWGCGNSLLLSLVATIMEWTKVEWTYLCLMTNSSTHLIHSVMSVSVMSIVILHCIQAHLFHALNGGKITGVFKVKQDEQVCCHWCITYAMMVVVLIWIRCHLLIHNLP